MDESKLTDLLAKLIEIPSVNPMGQEADSPGASAGVVDYVEAWCRYRQIDCVRQAVPGGEENLIATVRGKADGPMIVFDAHTDTVPADHRAFSPRVHGGRVYGRGACDTKGSLAAMMCAIELAVSEGTPHATVVLLASADEEYSRTGVRAFLNSKPSMDYAVVGEPTSCEPVVACKGAARWDIVVPGKSAHTSEPHRGINAIGRMALVVRLLEEFERTMLVSKHHRLVDPPTLTPSLVNGGTVVNIVPNSCRVTVDLRVLPDERPGEAMNEVQTFLDQRLDFAVEHAAPQVWHGADTDPEGAFVRHCVSCCQSVRDESHTVQPRGVNFGCHASDYSSAGFPVVVLGPGGIEAAHTTDEFVEIADLLAASTIYHEIMTRPFTSPSAR